MSKVSQFSPDKYLSDYFNYCRAAPFAMTDTAEQAQSAAASVRGELRSLLSLESIYEKCDILKPEILSSEKRKGYDEICLSVEICKGWQMKVYLLIPNNPSGSGVVALCGHGYGVRQIVRLDKRGRYRAVNFFDNYQKSFAIELVKRGCIVAAPELIAFGEARLNKDRHKPFYSSSCYTLTSALHLCGTSTAALRVYQATRCLDLLLANGTDSYKLGCMGISGGGLVSLLTACIDERISSAVVSGYIDTFQGGVLARWHCADNYIHSLARVGEPFDIAAAIAPRRLCIESGQHDKLFSIEGAREAHSKIRRVYELMGASDSLVIDEFSGKHRISGRKSFDFMISNIYI